MFLYESLLQVTQLYLIGYISYPRTKTDNFYKYLEMLVGIFFLLSKNIRIIARFNNTFIPHLGILVERTTITTYVTQEHTSEILKTSWQVNYRGGKQDDHVNGPIYPITSKPYPWEISKIYAWSRIITSKHYICFWYFDNHIFLNLQRDCMILSFAIFLACFLRLASIVDSIIKIVVASQNWDKADYFSEISYFVAILVKLFFPYLFIYGIISKWNFNILSGIKSNYACETSEIHCIQKLTHFHCALWTHAGIS